MTNNRGLIGETGDKEGLADKKGNLHLLTPMKKRFGKKLKGNVQRPPKSSFVSWSWSRKNEASVA